MRRIFVGKRYQHFKGKIYLILAIATHSETNEKFVVYQALYRNREVYIMQYNMFVSKVDKLKYPNSKQIYRFELIK